MLIWNRSILMIGLEAFFDLEAFGRFYVFQVDAAEGRSNRFADFNDFVCAARGDFYIEDIDAACWRKRDVRRFILSAPGSANFLKSTPLPSITGLDASGPRSPKPRMALPFEITATRLARAVRFSLTYPTPSEDTQDSRLSNLQILDAATLYIEGPENGHRVFIDFEHGFGHAGRISQRKVELTVAFSNVLLTMLNTSRTRSRRISSQLEYYFVEQLMESPYVYNFVTEFAEPIQRFLSCERCHLKLLRGCFKSKGRDYSLILKAKSLMHAGYKAEGRVRDPQGESGAVD